MFLRVLVLVAVLAAPLSARAACYVAYVHGKLSSLSGPSN